MRYFKRIETTISPTTTIISHLCSTNNQHLPFHIYALLSMLMFLLLMLMYVTSAAVLLLPPVAAVVVFVVNGGGCDFIACAALHVELEADGKRSGIETFFKELIVSTGYQKLKASLSLSLSLSLSDTLSPIFCIVTPLLMYNKLTTVYCMLLVVVSAD
jgi:hypothetical protein